MREILLSAIAALFILSSVGHAVAQGTEESAGASAASEGGVVHPMAIGNLLGTVTLPGNGNCNVGGDFDGTNYWALNGSMGTGCASSTLQIYKPPVGGNGSATLVGTKSIVNSSNNPVSISVVSWDPSRSKFWGTYNHKIYLIDTSGANAVATLMFSPTVGGLSLVDGLAYDPSDDTVYYSPDVNCNVYHYSTNGTLLNTVTPKNAMGYSDCSVSGVAIGTNNTLYIGRNGYKEIRRIHKTTGAFISTFATTSGRVEDLTCDPITYAPKEAILAKDAYMSLYEAFEVESGTCPLVGKPPEDLKEIKKEIIAIEKKLDDIVIPNLEWIKEKLGRLNDEVLRIEVKLDDIVIPKLIDIKDEIIGIENKINSIIETLKKLDVIIQQNKDIEEKLDCLIISIPQNNQAPGNLDKCRAELMIKHNLTERPSKGK